MEKSERENLKHGDIIILKEYGSEEPRNIAVIRKEGNDTYIIWAYNDDKSVAYRMCRHTLYSNGLENYILLTEKELLAFRLNHDYWKSLPDINCDTISHRSYIDCGCDDD